MRDVVLRTFSSLIILVIGYWAPKSYFNKFPSLMLFVALRVRQPK